MECLIIMLLIIGLHVVRLMDGDMVMDVVHLAIEGMATECTDDAVVLTVGFN